MHFHSTPKPPQGSPAGAQYFASKLPVSGFAPNIRLNVPVTFVLAFMAVRVTLLPLADVSPMAGVEVKLFQNANPLPAVGGAARAGFVVMTVYTAGKVVGGGAASLNSSITVPAGTFVSHPLPFAHAAAPQG